MKKSRIKFINIALCLLLIMGTALFGCKKGSETGGGDTSVTLNLSAAEMFIGGELSLTATVENIEAELSWMSSKKSIASVAGNGNTAVVTAHAVGNTTVRAMIGGVIMAECIITVVKAPDKIAISLPTGKLVLNQTGDSATIKASAKDSGINSDSMTWSSSDEKIAKVRFQGAIGYVTAVAAGSCEITVSGENAAGEKSATSCSVTVLKTVEIVDNITKTYFAYKADGTKSEKQFIGLANAVNELMNNGEYGKGSYITTVDDTQTKVYTFNEKSYNFFTRSGVYSGFDGNANVDGGQANYWDGFYKSDQLNLYANTSVNMLQYNGNFKNSWYYRKSEIITNSNGNLNDGYNGYRDSLYCASGAGVNYATWSDGKAYGISNLELNYDLSGSTMSPSQGTQSVYAEIYMRSIIDKATDKQKYYGVYFDSGTTESVKALEDGTKSYWYAYEGDMCYYDKESVTYPLQSKIRLNEEKPIGYSVWNKSEGKWVTEDLKVKLSLAYNFSDETAGAAFTADYTLSGEQKGIKSEVTYVYDGGKVIDRSAVRFTYGISLTPNAPKEDQVNVNYGFYCNTQVPDIYNGAEWTGVVQLACTGDGSPANDLSFIGTGTRQYVSIWGTDVCSYKKDAAKKMTVFNFNF